MGDARLILGTVRLFDTRGQWLRVERFGVARRNLNLLETGVGVATLMLAFTSGHSRVERFGVAPLTLELTLSVTRGQWLRVERHGPEDC